MQCKFYKRANNNRIKEKNMQEEEKKYLPSVVENRWPPKEVQKSSLDMRT